MRARATNSARHDLYLAFGNLLRKPSNRYQCTDAIQRDRGLRQRASHACLLSRRTAATSPAGIARLLATISGSQQAHRRLIHSTAPQIPESAYDSPKNDVIAATEEDASLQRTPADVPTPEVTAESIKLLMRKVPYPIAVITSVHREKDIDTGRERFFLHGMTVNSFNTVSLDPQPLVSFNARIPSSTATAIQQSGQFRVHILEHSQDQVEIAEYFSKARKPWEADSEMEARAMQDWGCCYYSLDCYKEQEIAVGDHSIMIGIVKNVVPGSVVNAPPPRDKPAISSRVRRYETRWRQPTVLLYRHERYGHLDKKRSSPETIRGFAWPMAQIKTAALKELQRSLAARTVGMDSLGTRDGASSSQKAREPDDFDFFDE